MLFVHRKLQIQLILYILFCVVCLVACAPTPNSVVLPSKTATRKAVTATITPRPTRTHTLTYTPQVPLPVVAIPETPTPGAGLITVRNVEKIEVLHTFGNGKAYNVAWSPNGKLMTVDTSLGTQIYDTETWQPVKLLGETSYAILDWSPDSKLLATLLEYREEGGSIDLYDGETLERIKTLRIGDGFLWSPTGEILAIYDSTAIYLYNMPSLKHTVTIRTGKSPGQMSFSPDGKTIATLYKGRVRLWDTTTGKLLSTFENFMDDNSGYVYNFEYSANGKNLLVLNNLDFNFEVFIFDVLSGEISYRDQESLEYRWAVRAVFRPDGLQMALQTYETVKMIDVKSGKVQKTLALTYPEHHSGSFDLAYSRDGKKLLTTAGIFDIETGVKLNDTDFNGFTISPQGGLLAGSQRSEVAIWDIQKDKYVRSVPAWYNWMNLVSFSPDEKKIAGFDEFGSVLVYEIGTGEILSKMPFNGDTYNLAFGPKMAFSIGYLLAVAEETGPITIWDVGNHQIIRTFLGEGGPYAELNPVAISPNGQLLAYHARGDGIHIVDIYSGKLLRNLADSNANVKMLAFSPDGRTILASGDGPEHGGLLTWDVDMADERLMLGYGLNLDFDFMPHTDQVVLSNRNLINFWDISTGDFISEFKKENAGEYEGYASTSVSADGRLLAAGTYLGTIDIWDGETRQLLRTIHSEQQSSPGFDGGADATIKGLTFSPHTHILATLGADGSIRVWDADAGLSLPFGAIQSLVFSPDGSLWAAGGYGQVRLFGLPTPRK